MPMEWESRRVLAGGELVMTGPSAEIEKVFEAVLNGDLSSYPAKALAEAAAGRELSLEPAGGIARREAA